MPEYCLASDLQNRLTVNGYTYVGDRDDGDGAINSSELAAHIDTAIEFAGMEIDAHIQGHYSTTIARASGNNWLKGIAVDIATARAFEDGGRGVPDYLDKARDNAMKKLERVRDSGQRIPGLNDSETRLTDAKYATALIANLSDETD